jgi:hypothetical protein
MIEFDPYQELLDQRDMIEELVAHVNHLIVNNNKLTDKLEYITSEFNIVTSLIKNHQERLHDLEDMIYDSE